METTTEVLVDNYESINIEIERFKDTLQSMLGDKKCDGYVLEDDDCNAISRVYVSVELDNMVLGSVEDANGNIFHEYRVNTSVNYPSYGAETVEVVMKRLDHIRQACELVKDFAKSYEGVKVWKMSWTKEEYANMQASTAKYNMHVAIKSQLKDHLNGLRVGGVRKFNTLSGFVNRSFMNTFEIELGKRKYDVEVVSEESAYVTRTV